MSDTHNGDLERIDGVCDAFEQAWRKDPSLRLEEFLQRYDSNDHDLPPDNLIRELVVLELELRRGEGDIPSPDEYFERLPQWAALLRTIFDEYERVASLSTEGDEETNPDATMPYGSGTTTKEGGPTKEGTARSGSRYQPVRSHAKGGLGEVFLAQDLELGREVALKEIQSRFADHPESQARFVLEAEVTGGLEHPGIVPVYGLGKYDDGRPYYAMKFIRGDSLQEAVDRFHGSIKRDGEGDNGQSDPSTRRFDSLEFRKLLTRFIDVCNAMAYAHARGVLHRDLKPGNIMLGKYGETLVVDWGLAKIQSREEHNKIDEEATLVPGSGSGSAPTQMGSVVGTPAFMPPEQAAGKLNQLSSSSDVYSLGATLYYVITGQAPFSGDTFREVLKRVEEGDFPAPRTVLASIPKPLESICLKAMATEPTDRYLSPQELANDVDRYLADEPIKAHVEPFSIRTRRWLRKHPRTVGSLAAALLIGLVSTVITTLLVNDAYQAERQAKGVAETRRKQAEEAEGRAQNRFVLAMDAMETFYTGVSEDVLLQEEELGDLRKELLKQPLDFYQRLQSELAEFDDPASRYALGRAYLAAAKITSKVGAAEDALVECRKANGLFHALVEEFPEDFNYQWYLAVSFGEVAQREFELGNRSQALAHFEEASGRLEQLKQQHPTKPFAASELAVTYDNMGRVQSDMSNPSAAVASYLKAIGIRNGLLEARPDHADDKDGLANGFLNLGYVQLQSGQEENALSSFERSERIWQELIEAYPEDLDYVHSMASSVFNKASALSDLGSTDKSAAAYEQAISLLEDVVRERPNVFEYEGTLANAYGGFGQLMMETEQGASAEKLLRKAISIQEELVARRPNVPDQTEALASNVNDLGLLQWHGDAPALAINNFKRTIQLIEPLVEKYPGVGDYVILLGGAYVNLGNLVRELGNLDGSLAWYEKAIAQLQRLYEKEPTRKQAREFLGKAYGGKGLSLSVLTRFDEAVSPLEQAVEILSDHPERRYFLPHLATAKAVSGDHLGAVKDAEELLTQPELTPEDLFEIAAVYSLAATIYGLNATGDKAEIIKQIEIYIGQSTDVLRQAKAAGGFKSQKEVDVLKVDPRFSLTIGNEKFKVLLEELEEGLK